MSKNRFLIFIRIFFILTLPILVISCSPINRKSVNPKENPELVDQSWLIDQPCTAPCWYGLIPGKTSREYAIETTGNLSFLDSKNIKLREITGASFYCIEPPNEVCVAMGFENNKLSNLWIYPNYHITLEQVVQRLGPPDSFYYSYKDPESRNCNLNLLWLKRQMILGYSDTQQGSQIDLCERIYQEKGKISKSLLIQSVNLKTSSEIEMIIETIQEPGTGQNYMLWKGFSD